MVGSHVLHILDVAQQCGPIEEKVRLASGTCRNINVLRGLGGWGGIRTHGGGAPHAGFQDRCLKPLGHPSRSGYQGPRLSQAQSHAPFAAPMPPWSASASEPSQPCAAPVAIAIQHYRMLFSAWRRGRARSPWGTRTGPTVYLARAP